MKNNFFLSFHQTKLAVSFVLLMTTIIPLTAEQFFSLMFIEHGLRTSTQKQKRVSC